MAVMKAIMLITDSEAMRDYERALLAGGHEGFTVMPALAGSGRRGLKTGDRVHPGGSSLLLAIVPQEKCSALADLLRLARDEGGHAGSTRMWSFDAEEIV
jgi:hypothetical protein